MSVWRDRLVGHVEPELTLYTLGPGVFVIGVDAGELKSVLNFLFPIRKYRLVLTEEWLVGIGVLKPAITAIWCITAHPSFHVWILTCEI